MNIFQRLGDFEFRSTIYTSIIGFICAIVIGAIFIYLSHSLKVRDKTDETPEETADRDDKMDAYIMLGSSLWVLSIPILLIGIIYYYVFYKGGTRKQTRIKESTGRWMMFDTLFELFK